MSQTNHELLDIPVGEIIQSDKALRDVDKESAEFKELVDSIRSNGVINAISVRLMENGSYELIDGKHRLNGSIEAQRETIPCLVFSNIDEATQLKMQIIGNVHRQETKPAQFAQNIKRLMAINPFMSISDVAEMVNKSTQWVNKIMRLNRLNDATAELVDDGKISLANAYALASLPEEEQVNMLEKAQTEPAETFVANCATRSREIKDANRKGRTPNAPEFTPMPRLRKVSQIKEEIDSSEAAKRICASEEQVEGFGLALNWVLSLDAETVQAERVRWEQTQKEREEQKKRRDAQRAAEKDKKAAEEAEKVRASIEA